MQYLWLALLLPHLAYQLPLAAPDTSLHTRSEGSQTFSLTRERRAHTSAGVTTGKVRDNKARSRYSFPLHVEGHFYNLEVDTASADTWIAGKDFKCYKKFDNTTNAYEDLEDQKICKYDREYEPGKGFSLQPDLHFQDCYDVSHVLADRYRCARGRLGYASVKIGDITVNQLIGVSNYSSYIARGEKQSGVLGLGQAGLTSAFNNSGSQVYYSPLMETIFNANLSTPLSSKQFSFALSRDHGKKIHGGLFTIGGTPPLTDKAVNVSSTTSSTAPWLIQSTVGNYYSIAIDGFVAGTNQTDANLSVIIDTGADTFQVPPDTATSMNKLWTPAIAADGTLSCKATLTEQIGVIIGGTTYYILTEDLIEKRDDGKCRTLIRPSDDADGYRLGDPFLRNVLAVFDWGNQAMEFYPRQYYKS